MSRSLFAMFAGAAVFASAVAMGGEILILQPAAPSSINRNEREAQRNAERARQQAGQVTQESAYVLEPAGSESRSRTEDQAGRLSRDARDYLDPAPSAGAGSGTQQVILRAAPPPSDAERAQQRARSYVTEPPKPAQRNCGTVTNQVGVIGEGSGARKGDNVIEKGGVVVDSNCR